VIGVASRGIREQHHAEGAENGEDAEKGELPISRHGG
jgi:hypothetical protein